MKQGENYLTGWIKKGQLLKDEDNNNHGKPLNKYSRKISRLAQTLPPATAKTGHGNLSLKKFKART